MGNVCGEYDAELDVKQERSYDLKKQRVLTAFLESMDIWRGTMSNETSEIGCSSVRFRSHGQRCITEEGREEGRRGRSVSSWGT